MSSMNNEQVAHVWAQQGETLRGRSSNGNFSFDGPTLYSYTTPIAVMHRAAGGELVALATLTKHSMTTSGKHMPAMCRAVHSSRLYYVPSIGEYRCPVDHEANLAHLRSLYAKEKARFAGKYGESFSGAGITVALMQRLVAVRHYANAFDLPFDDDAMAATRVSDDVAEIIATHEARSTPEARAKREREAAKRRAKREARDAAAARDMAQRWIDGSGASYVRLPPGWPVLLRVSTGDEGATLETSLGASVPLSHAIKVFRFVKAVRASGQTWERNGHTVRVGHFQVDRIEPSGDFQAGCHNIGWSEVERVARLVGCFDDEASTEVVEATHAHTF